MPVEKSLSFDITIYNSLDELKELDKSLMIQSIEARENAYAPYSKFNVGAAVYLENDEVVIGSNQENASYPSGLCAERVAVFQAGARFPGIKIKTIAITAASENYEVATPAAPCGNCRQAIFEYEFRQKEPIKLLLMGEVGQIVQCNSIADILPLGFSSTFLK
ncbi:cytidine deaminase [Maribacter sp. R77961]|jgi:cytidine deaminase|uniref:cytidine deaminase n=1 Tax=Maribacter sp. R77961 TaxID=3093871 RepID=UPI0037C7EC9A